MGGESERGRVGSSAEAGLDPAAEERARAAWCSWLSALATDANAAMAAAMAYESLPGEARQAWLDALEQDRGALGVPAVAVYAPLLAVESDAARCERIRTAIAAERAPVEADARAGEVRVLRGVAADGTRVCVFVTRLYLDFVELLSCRYTPEGGVVGVRHEPFHNARDLAPIDSVDGVAVEPTPLHVVVEELAHAILADRRQRRRPDPGLASFAHLFAPQLDPLAVGGDGGDGGSRGP